MTQPRQLMLLVSRHWPIAAVHWSLLWGISPKIADVHFDSLWICGQTMSTHYFIAFCNTISIPSGFAKHYLNTYALNKYDSVQSTWNAQDHRTITPNFLSALHLQDQMSCGKKCVIHALKDNMIAVGQCHLTDALNIFLTIFKGV